MKMSNPQRALRLQKQSQDPFSQDFRVAAEIEKQRSGRTQARKET